MPKTFLLSCLSFGATVIGCLTNFGNARAETAWREGLITFTQTRRCLDDSPEYGLGTFVAQRYDTSYAQPYVGQRFYMRIHIGGLGHPCADFLLDAQFIPPTGMTVSAEATYPVRCFYRLPGEIEYYEIPEAQGCPQPPFPIEPNFAGTGYRIDKRQPGDPTNPAWFLHGGGAYEFWIPVISNRAMDGLQDDTTFYAPVQGIDGVFNSWTMPFLAAFVAGPLPTLIHANGFE